MIDPFKRGKAQEVSIEEDDVVFACEGLEDCALIEFLTRDWSPRPKIGTRGHVEEWTWVDEFRQLADQVRMRRPAAVLFVFDAETSRKKAVANLRENCRAGGFLLPRARNRVEIKKVREVGVRLGFHINPHSRMKGAIESLFLPQIKATPDWPCLEALMGCYGNSRLRVKIEEKTIVRTYIARQKPHNTGLRVALQDGILRCDGPEFDAIKNFLDSVRPTGGSTAP